MKIVLLLGLMAVAISTVSSTNMYEVLEEEWDLFKVCIKTIFRI